MTTRLVPRALLGLPTPAEQYDRYNESQFRAALESQFGSLADALRALATDLGETVPSEMALAVVNKTGSTITTDKLVAVTGYDSTTGKPKIVLADADVASHDDLWVTTASIANNAEGTVYKSALSAANLDTSAAGAVGDPVYLATTAGGFTAAAPTSYASRVHPVGFVVVDHATTGQVLWLIGPVRKLGTGELQILLDTGAYTPTLTNVANLDASTAFECQWSRVGVMVTVSGKVDVDPTLTATATELGISLPITTNFAANQQASGVAFSPTIAAQGAAITADTTNDRAQMRWISGDITNQPMHFVFHYQVI